MIPLIRIQLRRWSDQGRFGHANFDVSPQLHPLSVSVLLRPPHRLRTGCGRGQFASRFSFLVGDTWTREMAFFTSSNPFLGDDTSVSVRKKRDAGSLPESFFSTSDRSFVRARQAAWFGTGSYNCIGGKAPSFPPRRRGRVRVRPGLARPGHRLVFPGEIGPLSPFHRSGFPFGFPFERAHVRVHVWF